MRLVIAGLSHDALVDTGAARSVIDYKLFVKICRRLGRQPLTTKSNTELSSFTGDKLSVYGTAQLHVDGVGSVSFVVVSGGNHNVILGIDQLRKGNACIDLTANTLKWFMNIFRLHHACSNVLSSIVETDIPIQEVLSRNDDLFATADNTGFCDVVQFEINTGTSRPIVQKPYRAPLAKRQIIEDQVTQMLRNDIIQTSISPWASPVCLVPKKTGDWRFCVDYRKLNAVTIKDKYPLPIIQDIFDTLQGAKIFSTLDLHSGYHQIPIHPNSIDKTSFVCHLGTFSFKRVAFGLTNAPSVFQRVLNHVLSDLIGKICCCYIDDIVVFAKDAVSHAKNLQIVFDRLRKFGLKLKRSKCHFGKREVDLLGFVINQHGLRPNPERVKAITELQPPKSLPTLRRFLGMTGYYRQCLPDYARINEPLVAMTRKHVRFKWNVACQEAFDRMKQLLVSDNVMAHPNLSLPYRLYCDASDYAIGGILVQIDPTTGIEKVIQYVSKQLSTTQRRWAVIEKEAFSVIHCLQKLRPYLIGAEYVVYTDHKPLLCLFTKSLNNTKIQRWSVLLAEYGATIRYRCGKNNIRADMLSRIESENVPDPTDKTFISTIDADEWYDVSLFDRLPDDNIPLLLDGLDREEVRIQQRLEFPDQLAEALDEDSSFELHDGLLYSVRKPTPHAVYYPRLVLPSRFQTQVVSRAHRSIGHSGVHKTLECVRDGYVWTRMRKTVKRFISTCPLCTVHTKRRQHTPMGTSPLAVYPMQIVGIDLMGPFIPSSNGNRYVLVAIDHCSSWVEAYPLQQKTAKCVLNALTQDFFARHGFPEIIISDNGREFTANEVRDYFADSGIRHNVTTPYRPQSNGKTERAIKTLKSMLTKLLDGKRADWEERLAEVLMAYRNSVSVVTGFTPFQLLYGRRSRLPLAACADRNDATAVPPFGNRLYDLSVMLNRARANTEQSRHYNRERLRRKANAQDLQVGDSVIVAANEPISLSARWDPQFEITRVVGTTHWLRHQRTGRQIKVHRSKLRLVDPHVAWDTINERPRRSRRRPPPPVNAPPVELSDIENEDEDDIVAAADVIPHNLVAARVRPPRLAPVPQRQVRPTRIPRLVPEPRRQAPPTSPRAGPSHTDMDARDVTPPRDRRPLSSTPLRPMEIPLPPSPPSPRDDMDADSDDTIAYTPPSPTARAHLCQPLLQTPVSHRTRNKRPLVLDAPATNVPPDLVHKKQRIAVINFHDVPSSFVWD